MDKGDDATLPCPFEHCAGRLTALEDRYFCSGCGRRFGAGDRAVMAANPGGKVSVSWLESTAPIRPVRPKKRRDDA